MDVSGMANAFDNGLAIGVIVLLFAALGLLLKRMIDNEKQNKDTILQKDSQLIEVINSFNTTVLKLNENYDRNLSNLIESNNRIEHKVDKIIDEITHQEKEVK